VRDDSVELINRVFETILGFPSEATYVFQSRMVSENEKIGLHVHVKLPAGKALTTRACKQLTEILDMVRFSYPETLGIIPVNEGKVFDYAVYSANENMRAPRGHPLRCIGQSKCDGSRSLVYIPSSSSSSSTPVTTAPTTSPESPPGLWDILAHGPQFDTNTGARVLYGDVVTDIGGIRDHRDIAFARAQSILVNDSSMNNNCCRKTGELMDAFNRRTLVFSRDTQSAASDLTTLLTIINGAWHANGLQMMIAHLAREVTERGGRFTTQHASWMAGASFVHDPPTDTICLKGGISTGRRHVPFCPRRPHEHRQAAPIRLTVGYRAGMISFILFVSGCYKSSCSGLSFLPQVYLRTSAPFPCRALKESTGSVFRRLFIGSKLRIKELISRSTAGTGDDDVGDDDNVNYEQCDDYAETEGLADKKKRGMKKAIKATDTDDYKKNTRTATNTTPRVREIIHQGKGAAAVIACDSIEHACNNVSVCLVNSRDNELVFYGYLANGWYALCIAMSSRGTTSDPPTIYVTHDPLTLLEHGEVAQKLPQNIFNSIAHFIR
jgi:hypothetical protein